MVVLRLVTIPSCVTLLYNDNMTTQQKKKNQHADNFVWLGATTPIAA